MTSLLSSIGRSLLISCMIPALVFVTVSLLIFAPKLPTHFLSQFNVIVPPNQSVTFSPDIENTLADFAGVLSIILVIAFVLAYTLKVMNWVVVRIFEGYYFPPLIKTFLIWRKQQKKLRLAQRTEERRHTLAEETEGTEEYQQHWRLYIELKNEHHEQYPPDFLNVLPTRLGNVYRAFEDYPFERYGMEGLFFWERLSKVIPDDYAAKIEELNNSVAFLLNSSLVSFIVLVEIILHDVVKIDLHLLNLVTNTRPFSFRILLSFLGLRPPSTKIVLTLLCAGLGYFFYHAAVSTAKTLGRHVRTSYDLFRLDLLDELNIDPPAIPGSQGEKDLWRLVHEFLALGEGSPYASSESKHTLSVLEDAIRAFRGLLWLSVQLKLWEGMSFLLGQIAALTDRSRYRSRYVVINDGAD